MRRRLRVVLAAAALAVGSALLAPAASAQGTPGLTVTPDSGLVDRQTVTVLAVHFPYSSNFLLQCPADVDVENFMDDYVRCGSNVRSFSNGVSTSFTVRTTTTTVAVGLGVPGPRTLTCGLSPNDCTIVALSYGPDEDLAVAAPISFFPDTPGSVQDCKNGGWRTHANDQRQPFRTQGQCLRYVLAGRPR